MSLCSPHINWKYKVHYQTENLVLTRGHFICQISAIPEVIEVKPMYQEGDVIDSIGTLDQIVLRVFIVADNKQSLDDVIDTVL